MAAQFRVFHVGARLMCLALLLITESAATASTREELENLGENEGVVVGSVLVRPEPPADPKDASMSFFAGRKATDLSYVLFVSEIGMLPPLFARGFKLSLTPEKEEFFVEKLSAGNYKLNDVSPSGFMAPQVSYPLGLSFVVKPQKVTYLGRVVVVLPNRIGVTTRFGFDVHDVRDETIEKLKNDYPSITSAATELLGSLVPGNTSASPRLQRDTLTLIHAMDGAHDTACRKRTVVNTEAIKKPTRPDDTGEERWTLDRCGKAVSYRVTFQPSARGGTDVLVKPEN